MVVFDTDVLSLFFLGHARVIQRVRRESTEVATTVISRIEVLQGRFDSVLKAADGAQLVEAHRRLALAESNISTWRVLPIDEAAAMEFDRLRADRKLRKIGRADLLIACIALAHRATLVTRNHRHFGQVPGLTVEDWAV